MIMKSNYQSTPNDDLENSRPKCKMHTQERQLTRLKKIFLQLIYKENRTDCFQNRTELEKSIPHISTLSPSVPMSCPQWLILRLLSVITQTNDNDILHAVCLWCRYARKHFVGLEESQYTDVQRCMGLLAFRTDCNITPYKVIDLRILTRWT